MKRWYVWLSILLAAVLVLVACSDDDGDPPIMGTDAPPVIGFLSVSGLNPQSDSTLRVPPRFEVVLNPVARGGKSIARVELNVNGINLPSKTSSPWEFEIDFGAITTTGPAIISAVAVDSQGLRSDPATQQVVVDATPPVVTIISPEEDEAISGDIEVVVTATDTGAGVRSLEVFFDGESIDAEIFDTVQEQQTFTFTIPVSGDGGIISDGENVIVARALDGIGNVGVSEERTIITRNQGAPIEPPNVEIRPEDITPLGGPIAGCTQLTCYQGTISVPVIVDDESGEAEVSLIVQSDLGTQRLGPVSSFPYTFRVDTTAFPDNSTVTLIAEGTIVDATEVSRSEPVDITVFNSTTGPVSPVNIVESAIEPTGQPIPGCSSSQCFRGVIRVPVAVRDAEGDAIVRLIVDGPFGTQVIGPLTAFPYIFELDSRIYPDNTELTLVAERRETEEGDPSVSSPVTITIFNSDATPPTVNVVRPENGSERSGAIPVTVEATDNESGISRILVIFDGARVIDQSFETPEADVTFESIIPIVDEQTQEVLPDGAYTLVVEVTNGAGLTVVSDNITVNTTNDGSPPPPPTEVAINDIEEDEDDALRVPVRVVVRPGDVVGQVTLTVRSEELGTQQPLVRAGTDTPYVFVVDTQEFANGDTLFFVARATTEAGGVANSEEVSFEVVKPGFIDVAPRVNITAPSSGEVVTTPIMPVEVSVAPLAEDSQFRFTSDITVEIINFRGDVTASTVIETSPKNTPIQQAQTYRTEFDITKFPNDVYTISATVSVAESETPIESVIQFRNRSSSDQPPASNIRLPVRLGETYNYPDCAIDGTECVGLPVLNRGSAIFIEISDDVFNEVDFLELRIICDPRIDTEAQDCENDPVDALLYNLDITPNLNLIKYIYISAPELDGSQFIRDGNYVLVMTTADTGDSARRNIQELAVQVDRSQDTIAGLRQGAVITTPDETPQQINPTSAQWFITGESDGTRGAADNPIRWINIPFVEGQEGNATKGTGIYSIVGINTFVNAGALAPSYAVGFSNDDDGVTHGTRFLVQDLVTGVVRQYIAPDVTPRTNPEENDDGDEENSRPTSRQAILEATTGSVRTIGVSEIATDPDGDTLTITSIVVPPAQGTADPAGSTSINYTAPSQAGTDFFTVEVSDGQLTTDVEVTVAVSEPASTPTTPTTP
ncbi:MAG: Ig-like domain-containing protein [Deinococcota bacterium]